MASRRPSLLFTVGAVLVLLFVAAPAALGSGFRLGFEDAEDAIVNEIWLDVPDDLLEVGALVHGTGHLEPLAQVGVDCVFFEFEFRGSVQPSTTAGLAEIRGVVERASYCGGELLARRDTGEFEVTITGENSIMGTITFPDEAEPRHITETIAIPASEGSTTGLSALFVIFASVAAVDVVATGICLLKRRPIWFVFGLGVSAVMIRLTIDSSSIDADAGLMALGLLAGFVVIGMPLTVILLIGASRQGKRMSWWVRRVSKSSPTAAPPPPVPRSDPGHDER